MLAACFALWAQLFGLAHQLLVPHTRCAEHGETVHASELHADPTRAAVIVGAPDVVMSSSDDDGGHEHDHCQALTERTELRAQSTTVTIAASPLRVEPVLASVVDGGARPLYRLAPKSSPPTPVG